MLRSILRTSRSLVPRQINKYTVAPPLCFYSLQKTCKTWTLKPATREFSSNSQEISSSESVDPVEYDKICNETLESLYEYFDELVDKSTNLKGADVTFSDGVLTVFLGPSYGTYVINRQTPNKQIWLSSPTSGPKRYDLILKNGGYWLYKHDGVTLHRLLQNEISKIVRETNFNNCSHCLM